MRILCLHGYLQTAEVFRKRTGALRRALEKSNKSKTPSQDPIQLLYLDAPLLVPDPNHSDDDKNNNNNTASTRLYTPGGRSWWFAHGEQNGNSLEYQYWNETLTYIRSFCELNQPIHGILGFSQGATVAALILALKHEYFEFSQIQCGIMISGFPPRDPALHQILFHSSNPIQIQSLHVIGERDQWVVPERSHALLSAWNSNYVHLYSHDKAHLVPSNRDFTQTLIQFLDQCSVDLR
mmetsp:Transcript_2147/g.3779  ORF Transcript_2147/g.3779 Transcript_2147/m.3779 type:complete len:237 (+) Transcript_2147:157-867(+)